MHIYIWKAIFPLNNKGEYERSNYNNKLCNTNSYFKIS